MISILNDFNHKQDTYVRLSHTHAYSRVKKICKQVASSVSCTVTAVFAVRQICWPWPVLPQHVYTCM